MNKLKSDVSLASSIAADKSVGSLDALLDGLSTHTDRVYILSEVGYDTVYFNSDAYATLLSCMKRDSDLSGIIIDGPLTRLDRPEFLNVDLTYWEKGRDICEGASRTIKNSEQYDHMFSLQLETLDLRLKEVRALFPQTPIYCNIDTDDFQFTLSAMLNEALLRKTQEVDLKINHLKNKRSVYREELSSLRKDLKKDSSTSFDEVKVNDGGLRDVGGAAENFESGSRTTRIDNLEQRLANIDSEISEEYTKKNLFREKKVRPAHQLYTREIMEDIYARIQQVCDSSRVVLLKAPSHISFSDLVMHFSHNSRRSWVVSKGIDEGYVGAHLDYLRGLRLAGVDCVVESGHHGCGFKQLQKLYDTVSETNFQNQGSSSPHIGQDHMTVVFALPFEDQQKIGLFLQGDMSVRMSGGKPIGTRKIAAIDRMHSGGVSGVTVIGKDRAGLISTEWISYDSIITCGNVLLQTASSSLGAFSSSLDTSLSALDTGDVGGDVLRRALIFSTSDEHIGSPEENILVRKAASHIYSYFATHPLMVGGVGFVGAGYISGGDTGEANSKKWNHRYHFRLDPMQLLYQNIEKIQGCLKGGTPVDFLNLLHSVTSDAKAGSVEDMQVILQRVADYYDSFFSVSSEHSQLQYLHLSVPGNHADGVLVDLGLRESDFFVQRLHSRGVEVFEVGKQSSIGSSRVGIGGYSSARILQIPDYGKNIDGSNAFGPVNLLIQHDPKGNKSSGLVGAGRAVQADLALAGHTHETYVKTYSCGANKFGVAYRLATLQGTTATEKYYAASPPRTQAAHLFIPFGEGHFFEKTIPAPYLEKVAKAHLEETVRGVMFSNN